METVEHPKPDWRLIRLEYEKTAVSQRALAKRYGVPQSTLMKRAMREGWKQQARLVEATVSKLEAMAEEKAIRMVSDELAPFIEQKKIEITKRGFNLSARGLDRVEALWDTKEATDSKVEAETARALETLVRVGRTSLGMNESSTGPQPLSLNILTNQAAVQIVSGSNEQSASNSQ